MKRVLHFLFAACCIVLPCNAITSSDLPLPQDSVVGAPIPADMKSSNDSTILFRFVPGKTMFYSPYKDNEKAILQAGELIARHHREIVQGKAYIVVKGFCGSYPTAHENLQAAKTRSNHVKSYFILHNGMKEDYYGST